MAMVRHFALNFVDNEKPWIQHQVLFEFNVKTRNH